jgi:hypothetical protein
MEFPQEAAALAMFIFLLGLRHGMDPGHIAAATASRAMACVIGLLSVGVGALGALKHLYPYAAAFYEGRELYFGAALVATTTVTFFVAGRKTLRSAQEERP